MAVRRDESHMNGHKEGERKQRDDDQVDQHNTNGRDHDGSGNGRKLYFEEMIAGSRLAQRVGDSRL